MAKFVKCFILCAIFFTAATAPPAKNTTKGAALETPKSEVIRVVPQNEDDIVFLRNLTQDPNLDFLNAPGVIGQSVMIMLDSNFLKNLRKTLRKNKLKYSIVTRRLQRIAEKEIKSAQQVQIASRFGGNDADFELGRHHSYSDIVEWLRSIQRRHPNIARVFTIGNTHEKRRIYGITIGNRAVNRTTRAVWIDGGMHAREWTAVHTALYFIHKLISSYGVEPALTAYLDTLTFHILPVANPDGYEYSRSSSSVKVRYWRKNRNPNGCAANDEKCCKGVDLNRNFDISWNEPSRNDPCLETYSGKAAFSEPEARAIRNKIMSPKLRGKWDAFISLHAFSQLWTYPYNYKRDTFPEDVAELYSVGLKAAAALKAVHGTEYRVGSAVPALNIAGGGSDDWAKAVARAKFVYLLELPPKEMRLESFILDESRLIPVGEETWAGVRVVVDEVMQRVRAANNETITCMDPPFDKSLSCKERDRLIRCYLDMAKQLRISSQSPALSTQQKESAASQFAQLGTVVKSEYALFQRECSSGAKPSKNEAITCMVPPFGKGKQCEERERLIRCNLEVAKQLRNTSESPALSTQQKESAASQFAGLKSALTGEIDTFKRECPTIKKEQQKEQ